MPEWGFPREGSVRLFISFEGGDESLIREVWRNGVWVEDGSVLPHYQLENGVVMIHRRPKEEDHAASA